MKYFYSIPFFILLVLSSCEPIIYTQIDTAIINQDFLELEHLLDQLKNDNPQRHKDMIDDIELKLYHCYATLGDDLSRQGQLEQATKKYFRSLSFQRNSQNKHVETQIDNINKEMKTTEKIHGYLFSDDTTDFFQYGMLLWDSYNKHENSSLNCRSYLASKLGKPELEYFNNLYKELKFYYNGDINLPEMNAYLSKITCSADSVQSEIQENLILKAKKYQKLFENLLFDENRLNIFENRLELIEYIKNNSNCSDNECNKIQDYIKQYYLTHKLNSNSSIRDIYEHYQFSTLSDETIELYIENAIKNYISDHSYKYVFNLNKTDRRLQPINKFLTINKLDKRFSFPSKKQITLSFSVKEKTIKISPRLKVENINSKYLVGSYSEPNPEYNRKQLIVSNATQNYNRAAREGSYDSSSIMGALLELARINQLGELERAMYQARRDLAQTPTTISVDDYQSYSYEQATHKVYGKLLINLQVSSNLPGIKRSDIPIEAVVSKTLVSREGVVKNDYYYAKEKHIYLPTDQVLENILYNKLCVAIEDKIQEPSQLNPAFASLLFSENQVKTELEPLTNRSDYNQFISFIKEHIDYTDALGKGAIQKIIKPTIKYSKWSSNELVKLANSASVQVCAYNNDFETALGTGYLISTNGYYITNHHIISNKSNIILMKKINGKIQIKNAEILFSDETRDLALLKTHSPFQNSQLINVWHNDDSELGDGVLYIGYPGSPISNSTEPFLSKGMINQVMRSDYGNPVLILFDVTANVGASGSAVISSTTGNLVGTLTWGFGRSITTEDILNMLGGTSIRISESQNVGTSASVLRTFLEDSGYLQ